MVASGSLTAVDIERIGSPRRARCYDRRRHEHRRLSRPQLAEVGFETATGERLRLRISRGARPAFWAISFSCSAISCRTGSSPSNPPRSSIGTRRFEAREPSSKTTSKRTKPRCCGRDLVRLAIPADRRLRRGTPGLRFAANLLGFRKGAAAGDHAGGQRAETDAARDEAALCLLDYIKKSQLYLNRSIGLFDGCQGKTTFWQECSGFNVGKQAADVVAGLIMQRVLDEQNRRVECQRSKRNKIE